MITRRNLLALSLLLISVTVFCGCGGESDSDGGATPTTTGGDTGSSDSASGDVKTVSVAGLPKLAEYQPPLEGGTVEVAPPNGWSPLPRSEKFLIRFFHQDKTKLPRIEISSAPNPLDDVGDVTSENVAEFAKEMAPISTQGGRKVIEPCLPLIFGDSAWARHVRLAKSSSGMVQIQSLQTIRGGRLYTVDLLVEGEEAADLKKYKDYGYAVAAGMKFGGGGGTDFKVPLPEAEPVPMEPAGE